VKTYYEVLGLEASAGADAIKKAFRREIARYHPDKVIHLGAEFQEMAATRAAELTVAYKTLTDPALRREYDASVDAGLPPPHSPSPPRPEATAQAPADVPAPDEETVRRKSGRTRFAAERADSDLILRRAIASRMIAIVESLYGKVETPIVRGFDLAMVPIAKARFLGSPPPRVLLKVLETVDSGAVIEAYNIAARTKVHAGKSPLVVLLLSRNIAQAEISKANDVNGRQRKVPDGPDEVAVVVVDTSDWSCRLPPNCSSAVQKLTAQISSR
jgi:hypothetical protein